MDLALPDREVKRRSGLTLSSYRCRSSDHVVKDRAASAWKQKGTLSPIDLHVATNTMPAFVDKLNITLGPKGVEEPVGVTPAEPPAANDEEANHPDKDSQDNGSVVSDNVQHGVANQQAITLSWTKKSLAFLFIKYELPRI